MPEYKLVALDLDDTLLNSNLNISDGNREAINKAKELGVKVTISTGRMYRSALAIAKELDLKSPLITYQGALIKDPVSEQTIVHRPLPMQQALEVIDLGYQRGYPINVYVNDNLYIDHITPEAEHYARTSEVPLNPVGDLRKFLREEPTKVLFIGHNEELDDFHLELQEKYPQLHITKSKSYYLEVMHPLATKGHALQYLAAILDIPMEQVIAIGDSYNDVDMINAAGLGVAMGNSWDKVKEIADYVTYTHDEDGVAKVINKFILD